MGPKKKKRFIKHFILTVFMGRINLVFVCFLNTAESMLKRKGITVRVFERISGESV